MGMNVYGGIPGVKRRTYTGKKISASRKDYRAIALAMTLQMNCRKLIGDALAPRIDAVPDGRRDWKGGIALLGRVLDMVVQTVPDEQFERLYQLTQNGDIDLNLHKAVRMGGDVITVSESALNLLTDCVMRSECSICLREGGHVRSCPINRALAGVTEPETWETSGCAWRDEALRRLGKEE